MFMWKQSASSRKLPAPVSRISAWASVLVQLVS